MPVRQILHEDLGCASYLISDGGEAAVVDPKWEIDDYLQAARDADARIIHILETHHHADHVSGRRRLAAATGAAVHLPADPSDPLGAGVRPGDSLRIGNLELRALATDGHRPEHLAFAVLDWETGAITDLLSGDSVLVGDVARPDLAVRADQGARDLWATLRRLDRLPDSVVLWPAHVGGSLCASSSASSETFSTLGRERETNPMLRVRDREQFMAEITARPPARPPSVERVVALNRLGAEPPREQVPAAVAGRLGELLHEGAAVLDVRDPAEFDRAHLAGSLNLPLTRTGMGTRAGWAAGTEQGVVIVAPELSVARGVAEKLRAAGMWNVSAVAQVDLSRWEASGLGVVSASALDAESLARLLARHEVDLLDVRDPREWDDGHVDGARHLPLSVLRDGRDTASGVPLAQPLAVGCAGGVRAALAASVLRRAGFAQVARLAGGIGELPAFGISLIS